MSNHFSQQQLQSFKRDGFLVIHGMYRPAEIQEMSSWIDELVARPPQAGKEMAYFEDSLLEKGKRILSRIEKFSDFHDSFHRMVHEDHMVGRVSELLGEPAILFKEKINFKMPGGAGFEPHQDIQPGWDTYADYFISVLVTIDESTVENGCLELAAAHHTRGLIGQKWKPLQGKELEGIEFKKYPMKPGDVAFFDCFVPHQSAPNLTSRQRRNLYLTYNRQSQGESRESYFSDKRKSFPPDFERDPGKEYKFRV